MVPLSRRYPFHCLAHANEQFSTVQSIFALINMLFSTHMREYELPFSIEAWCLSVRRSYGKVDRTQTFLLYFENGRSSTSE